MHGPYANPAWSPDGRKIAIEMAGVSSSIWVYDVASKVFSRLTTHIDAIRPAWTSDGKRVAFVNDEEGASSIWSVPADKSGPEELFYALPGESLREVTFSADAKYAVFRTDTRASDSTKDDLYYLPLQGSGERKAMPLVKSPFQGRPSELVAGRSLARIQFR